MSDRELRNKFWWLADGSAMAQIIRQRVTDIDSATRRERWESAVFTRLYEDSIRYSARGPFKKALDVGKLMGMRVNHLNVMASVINAVIAKLARNRPAIKVDVDNAHWGLRKRARDLSEVIRTFLDQWNDQALQGRLFRDGMLTQYGCARVTGHHDKIGCELIPQEEIFIDPRGAKYGKPREIFHRYEINRHVLAERISDMDLGKRERAGLKSAILNAPAATHDSHIDLNDTHHGTHVDESMIWIYEATHLPSGPDAKDGKTVGCIEGDEEAGGAVLWTKPWEVPRFDYIFFRYQRRRFGFAGIPLAAELFPIQALIDKTLGKMVNNLHFTGDLIILNREGNDVDVTQMGNMGKPYEVKYKATKPEIFVPDPFSVQQFNFLEFLINKAFELPGVSQALAGGNSPVGPDASGVSRQEFHDQSAERLSSPELDFARANRDLAEVIIDTAKRIHKRTKKLSLSVKWKSNRSAFEKIDWDDVDMERDQFTLGLEATNFIPESRAGKIAIVEALAKFQVFTPEMLPGLFGGAPDIDRAFAEQNAARNHIEWLLERVLKVKIGKDGEVDDDKSLPPPKPDRDMELELGKVMTHARLQIESSEGAPQSVLDRLRTFEGWIDELLERIAKAAREEVQAQQVEQAAAAGAAGAPLPGANGALPLEQAAVPLPEQALPGPETLQ